jgi:SAM-dependent methyltransferase
MSDARYELGPSSNIFSAVLPEGVYYPDIVSLEDERPPEFVAYYNSVRSKPWRECTILDLGCGEGSSTVAIGRTGARVIGLEGRPEIVRRAEYLRDRLGYTNVEFRIGNVLDAAHYENVDAVFASGLIHHLEFPFELMQLIGKHCREFAYFCTHFAPRDDADRKQSFFATNLFDPGTVDFAGKPLAGIKFIEGADTREEQGLHRRHPRTGIGNQHSWWPSGEGFTSAMAAVGFPHSKHIAQHTRRLRNRICFSRTVEIGSPRIDADTYFWATPERPPLRVAAERAAAADTLYLKQAGVSPALIGVGPAMFTIINDFAKHGIRPSAIYLPEGADPSAVVAFAKRLSLDIEARSARNLPLDKPSHVVVAADDFALLKQYYGILLTLSFCKYVFTSFSLLATRAFPDLHHPVVGDVLPRRDDPALNY